MRLLITILLFCLVKFTVAQSKDESLFDISYMFRCEAVDSIYSINIPLFAKDFPLNRFCFVIDSGKEEFKQLMCSRIIVNHDNIMLSCYYPAYPTSNILLVCRIYDLPFNENIPIFIHKYFQVEYSIGDKIFEKKFYINLINKSYKKE